MFNLSGKIALVTGASRGIGKGIAMALATAGADVVINYNHSLEEAENVADEILSMGRLAEICQADVTDEQQVNAMFQFTLEKFGRLDILVNNAGTSQAKDVFTMELEDWQRIMDINLKSAFLCSKQAMEIMRKQEHGRIISIASQAGERGALFGHIHYAASKSGILAMNKTLARTGAPYNITVNSVAPGVIYTDFTPKVHSESEIEGLRKSIPLGLGKTSDVGAACVYLASDEASYVTGITLDVNGGSYIH